MNRRAAEHPDDWEDREEAALDEDQSSLVSRSTGGRVPAYLEPIGVHLSATAPIGPFEDEIAASEFMDENNLNDAVYKIVLRA